MRKILFLVSTMLVSSHSVAKEETKYNFVHPEWTEEVTVTDSKFCRGNGDCATIERINENNIRVKWKKWGTEEFFYDSEQNTWNASFNNFDKQIEDEYSQFVFTFEKPYVKVNPYKMAPLSALIKFETEKETKISIRIKGKNGAPDIVHSFDEFKTEHEIPVIGLYANHENKVILQATDKNGKSWKTEVPIRLSKIEHVVQFIPLKKNDKSFYYYSTYEGDIWDENGDLRFLLNTSGWRLSYLRKNHVYVERRKYIQKYSMLGKLIKTYYYPKGFYGYMHGMSFKDNGNLLVFGTYEGTKALIDGKMQETNRDIIHEIDAEKGTILATYDLAEMINPNRELIVKSANVEYGKIDWAHTNGIDYDEKNKAIIVSGRHIGIVKIDEKTQKPVWWLTPHQLTDKSGRKGDKGDVSHLLLTAVDKNGKPYDLDVQKGIKKAKGFKWPLKTHSVRYVGNGMYSIFDNSGKMWDKNLYTTDTSYASVFKIDDKKKTVQQIFLNDVGDYSAVGSSVFAYPDKKQYFTYISDVRPSYTDDMRYGLLYRYDNKGNVLFKAMTRTKANGWIHAVYPYEFYAK